MSMNLNQAPTKPRAERIPIKLPIAIKKNDEELNLGLAQNISSSGIYFESDFSHTVGSQFDFMMNIDISGRALTLNCTAEIVRLDSKNNKNYLAAKIIKSSLSE